MARPDSIRRRRNRTPDFLGTHISATLICLFLSLLPLSCGAREEGTTAATEAFDPCSRDCSSAADSPVCGTDLKTYMSKCELNLARHCGQQDSNDDQELRLLHRGECSEEYDSGHCKREREEALRQGEESGIPVWIPVCRADGSFADVQCHYGTGYCWCVDQQGAPIQGTSKKYQRPDCRKSQRERKRRGKRKRGRRRNRRKNKKNMYGEDQHRDDNSDDVSDVEDRKVGRGGCTQSDRTEFNSDVLEIIGREFRNAKRRRTSKKNKRKKELPPSTGGGGASRRRGRARNFYHGSGGRRRWKRSGGGGDRGGGGAGGGAIGHKNQEAVDWKFKRLDEDGDGTLRKREFKSFRLDVRQLARNKACARHFWHYCDRNSDKRISQEEWDSCLGMDVGLSFELFQSLTEDIKVDRRKTRKQQQVHSREEAETEDYHDDEASTYAAAHAAAVIQQHHSQQQYQQQQGPCWSERQSTMTREPGNPNVYLPACATDGRFERVQCYESSGWCWCAEQDTGRQIPNTSVQHARPECGGGEEEDPMAGEEREWKKCPGERREQFRRELQELLVGEMSAKTGRWTTKASGPELVPREEQAARWKFQQMDRNRDRVISRKELRPLRRALQREQSLRLCGKRIQLHCDPDGDQRVTQEEWEVCLGLKRHPASTAVRPSTSRAPPPSVARRAKDPSKRRGRNPLEKWLKQD